MAITYPRTLPFSGSIFDSGSDLSLSRADARNRDGSGMIEVMELGDPLWTLKLVTKPLRPSVRAAWKAWALSLQGGIQLFYGYHPILQYPLAYGVSVLGLFNGDATLTTPGAFTLPLTGLPANYKVSVGDMISVPLSGGAKMLHTAVEAVTASGGGAATVTVAPFVRSDTATGTAKLVKAPALFVIKNETFSAPDGEIFAPVSFEAQQTVRSV